MAFALGPIADRPRFGHPQIERFSAFLALSLGWAAAVLLEAAQGLPDVLAKIAGSVTAAALFAAARRRRTA